MTEFRIGNTDSAFLTVRIVDRLYPEAKDWEVNRLQAEATVVAGGFSGNTTLRLLVGELALFRDHLEKLYSFERLDAGLEPYDGQLLIEIQGDRLGNFTGQCDLWSSDGYGRLIFPIAFDQTELPEMIRGLNSVLSEYPFLRQGDI